MFLSTQGSRDTLCAIHHAATLVIQTEDRGHTIPAGRSFQRGGNRFGETNASSFGSGSCRKSGNKGLLLHSRLRLKRTGKIMQIPHLISLISGKSHRIAGDEGLHLHIVGGHQRTGYTVQVDPLVSLINVIRSHLRCLKAHREQTCLNHQSPRQLLRQWLAALLCPTQNAEAGFLTQIVFRVRISL